MIDYYINILIIIRLYIKRYHIYMKQITFYMMLILKIFTVVLSNQNLIF